MEDKAAAETERLRLIDKMFACAEQVVRQCIADALPNIAAEINPPEQTSDVIGFYIDEKPLTHMTASLIYQPPDFPACVAREDTDDVRKICSMIYDGMHIVFGSVCGEYNANHAEKIEGLVLNFNNESMAFVPCFINYKLQEFNAAIRRRDTLRAALDAPENTTKQTEILADIAKIQFNTLEAIDECEILTAERNLTNRSGWIYIKVEDRPADLDLCLTRLTAVSEEPQQSMTELLARQASHK